MAMRKPMQTRHRASVTETSPSVKLSSTKNMSRADAHQHFGDGNGREHQHRQHRQPLSVKGQSGHCAENRRHHAGHDGDDQRVARRGQHFVVLEQLFVPVEREADRLCIQARIVEE